MSDTYVECLVQAKGSGLLKVLKVILTVLAVILGLLGMSGFLIGIVGAVLFGVGAYFAYMNADVEYEYLYLERELVIDKVMAKSKRKRMGTYTVERMEVLAPVKSYHLDNFKNRDVKVLDFSIGREEQPDLRYALYYEGGTKLILSPSEELIKALKSVAPRKVFSD